MSLRANETSSEGRKYEEEKEEEIDGKKCKCARKDVKKKTKMETRWKSEWNRNVQKFNFLQITSVQGLRYVNWR